MERATERQGGMKLQSLTGEQKSHPDLTLTARPKGICDVIGTYTVGSEEGSERALSRNRKHGRFSDMSRMNSGMDAWR